MSEAATPSVPASTAPARVEPWELAPAKQADPAVAPRAGAGLGEKLAGLVFRYLGKPRDDGDHGVV